MPVFSGIIVYGLSCLAYMGMLVAFSVAASLRLQEEESSAVTSSSFEFYPIVLATIALFWNALLLFGSYFRASKPHSLRKVVVGCISILTNILFLVQIASIISSTSFYMQAYDDVGSYSYSSRYDDNEDDIVTQMQHVTRAAMALDVLSFLASAAVIVFEFVRVLSGVEQLGVQPASQSYDEAARV